VTPSWPGDELERWCTLVERALADDGIDLALDAIKSFPGPIEVERPTDDLEAARLSRLGERVSHLARQALRVRRQAEIDLADVSNERRQLHNGAANMARYAQSAG
jgi:hypothetical protein